LLKYINITCIKKNHLINKIIFQLYIIDYNFREEKLRSDPNAIVFIPDFFKYVRNKVIITFKERVDKENEHFVPASKEFDEFQIELMKTMNYDEVSISNYWVIIIIIIIIILIIT